MTRSTAALVALAIALVACSSGGEIEVAPPEPLPPEVIVDPPMPGPPDRAPEEDLEPTYVDVHADAVDPQLRDWAEVFVLDDGGTLELRWWGGVEPCEVVGAVDVEYGEDVVTVGLRIGSAPAEGGEDRACITIARYTAVRVPLDEPVGTRSIVDAVG